MGELVLLGLDGEQAVLESEKGEELPILRKAKSETDFAKGE